MQGYEIQYNNIVKNRKKTAYFVSDNQVNSIKRCSILRQTKEIKYSSSITKNPMDNELKLNNYRREE